MTGSVMFRSRRTGKSGGLTRQHNLDKALVPYRNNSDRRGVGDVPCPGDPDVRVSQTCSRPDRVRPFDMLR